MKKEHCEICGLERTYKCAELVKNKFESWLYNCECPIYMLDEIDTVRKSRKGLNIEQRKELVIMRDKKKHFGILMKWHPDMFNKKFFDIKDINSDEKDNKGNFKHSDARREQIINARQIHKGIKYILKDIENEIRRNSNY